MLSRINKALILCLLGFSAGCHFQATAHDNDKDNYLFWDAGTSFNVGSGTFAPYYISSLTHGTVTQSKGWLLHASLKHELDTAKRFSWGAAAEFYGGISSKADYLRMEPDGQWYSHGIRPSALVIQQLYAEIKYRGLFVEFGLKDRKSPFLDNSLTSGDFVQSGNARSVPQLRFGFIDFQNIPFTKGWVQIQGELAWGKYTDYGWLENFYSRASSHITKGSYYLYRHLYFRTKPSERFCFTIGMQAAGQISGITEFWYKGNLSHVIDFNVSFGRVITAIIPGKEGSGVGEYYGGSNLGSWDIMGRYDIPGDNGRIHAYLQKPWEKGSSIGFMNGWDGLWGVEYEFNSKSRFVNAFLFEYIYLLNQSGPIHYAIHDYPGTTITTESQGRDNYYNNGEYNSYQNYGVGLGTPFLKAPIYNLDGYPAYVHNLVKGFHMAARGHINPRWEWKVAISYKEGFGTGEAPTKIKVTDFSWLIEAAGSLKNVPGLKYKVQIAADHGSYLGNNFGIFIGAVYKGSFLFKK